MLACTVSSFEEWRAAARWFLANDAPPEDVHFQEEGAQQNLFDDAAGVNRLKQSPSQPVAIANVPRKFLEMTRLAFCHRDAGRFELLYRLLWRLTHGEPHLLEVSTDDDVHQLQTLAKAVRRDAHKMKAFVRFRRVELEDEEHFVAWHCPDHRVVRLVAPFFARRFLSMRWTIFTPDDSATWDLEQLRFGPGANPTAAPKHDDLQELWKTYYASIFNPARIKLEAMKREMPVRHWKTLPETSIIPDLLAEAPLRVAKMVTHTKEFGRSAANHLPADRSFESLRAAAAGCQGCELYCDATQTVFGEGSSSATIMFVGEQPGDAEDIAGRPFVGPAGQVFDEALAAAGLQRRDVYITNAVKHFRFLFRGKRRIHNKPSIQQALACHPWLEAELALVRPKVLVCLGATAAQALIGPQFRITRERGKILATPSCTATIATYHPSAVLRARDASHRAEIWQTLVADLTLAAAHVGRDGGAP